MDRSMGHVLQAAEGLAQGDLSVGIRAQGSDEVVQLLNALAAMREGFARMLRHVKVNSDSVATASNEIAQGNQDLSNRTEVQASALQRTAATMVQLGSTARGNAESALQAHQQAQGASAVAAQGGEVVGQVVATMQGINDSSRKIGAIMGFIDGIAFQTNMLALNAAMEAARRRTGPRLCGGGGRGAQPGAAQRRSCQGHQDADRPWQSSSEQEVGDAVSRIDQSTQQNAALVEQSAAAAESLKGQAQQLLQPVSAFKLAQEEALRAQ